MSECKTSTKKALIKFLKGRTRVLEFGSGPGSTPLIHEFMHKNGGLRLSLESNEEYFRKTIMEVPDDEHGETKCVPLECDISYGCRYKHPLEGKFDLVFVDGPAELTKEQHYCVDAYFKKVKSCLKSSCQDGAQSSCLFDQVFPFLTEDAVIVVDGRKASVAHCLSNSKFASYKFFGYPQKKRCRLNYKRSGKIWRNIYSTTIIKKASGIVID